MFYCKILLNRSMPYEEHTCRALIPIKDRDAINVRIINCSSIQPGIGYSMMRILTDGKTQIPEGKVESPSGECTISRMSSTHYTAMIINRQCYLCGLLNENRCFLMSSVPVDDTDVEWTIVGADSNAVHNLIHRMKDLGYRVTSLASGSFGDEMSLTVKEEDYLSAAYNQGYYDVPRRIDLDGLCKSLGCSKSTLNVALRTAERKVISRYKAETAQGREN